MSSTTVPSSKPFPLLEFPNELLLKVASHLEAPDINSLMRTNRHFAGLFKIPLLQAALYYVPTLYFYLGCGNFPPGTTVFAWAVDFDRCDLAAALLDTKGSMIDINRDGPTGKLPLELASSTEMTRLLLERGARVPEGWNGYALRQNRVLDNLELTKFWLETGVDANSVDAFYSPILNTYIYRMDDQYIDFDVTLAIIEELLKHGADVNRRDRDGNTPLHLVAQFIDGFCVRDFPERCAETKANLDLDPRKSLFNSGYIACLKLLFRYGADLKCENADGNTFLGMCQEIVKSLQTARSLEASLQHIMEEVETSNGE